MGKVVKVVNYIRGHAFKYRQFRTLVKEYETQYQVLTLHTEVRWLSRGIVLEKFVDLLLVIWAFIVQRKCANLYYVNDEKFAMEVAFLADITKNLNSLNLKLQGNNKLLPALMNDVSAFMEKLSFHQDQLGNNDFAHFPNLRSQVSQLRSISFEPVICVQYLSEFASEFSCPFNDLRAIIPVMSWKWLFNDGSNQVKAAQLSQWQAPMWLSAGSNIYRPARPEAISGKDLNAFYKILSYWISNF